MENTLFDSAIEHWRLNKGNGTVIIPTVDDSPFMYNILLKLYQKKNDMVTLIIVNNYYDRIKVIKILTESTDTALNGFFESLIANKYIRIFSADYVKANIKSVALSVTILYHCDAINDTMFDILNNSKFKLVMLDKLKLSSGVITKLFNICPLIDDFKQQYVDELRTSTPVEEIQVGVSIPETSEEFKLLEYYDRYIKDCIAIFGSIDNIQYARTGNPSIGMSAAQFCQQLALENGWSDRLDMSIEINARIDEFYNPNAIRDRANDVYNKMRERKHLLADYVGKLHEIYSIIKEHDDKKILIISKYGNFAADVTKYINLCAGKEICGNYHDNVEPIPAFTLDGEPILVKSGLLKGQQKLYHAKAQKSYNEARFNAGLINVLSTSNSPDKTLNIEVDLIIITSPECEDVESYKYRLNNVYYRNNLIKLYTLYIINSSEDKKRQNVPISATRKVTEKSNQNSNFIIAD
jgi:hypothetical protein